MDVCAQPVDPGPCQKKTIRWAFHSKAGRCKRFKYGGCFGNENSFDTEEKCNQRCPPKGKKFLFVSFVWSLFCFAYILVSLVLCYVLKIVANAFFHSYHSSPTTEVLSRNDPRRWVMRGRCIRRILSLHSLFDYFTFCLLLHVLSFPNWGYCLHFTTCL